MSGEDAEIEEARRAIRAFFSEKPKPLQKDVAAATGLSQGYVAKIAKCDFGSMKKGVRKVWEYSRLGQAEHRRRVVVGTDFAQRLNDAVIRLASRDPSLGEALVEFIDRLSNR